MSLPRGGLFVLGQVIGLLDATAPRPAVFEFVQDFRRYTIHRRDEPVRVPARNAWRPFRVELVAEYANVPPGEVRHGFPWRVPQTDDDEDSGDHESYAIE
jgi:hypothetical protein